MTWDEVKEIQAKARANKALLETAPELEKALRKVLRVYEDLLSEWHVKEIRALLTRLDEARNP